MLMKFEAKQTEMGGIEGRLDTYKNERVGERWMDQECRGDSKADPADT